MKLLKQIMFLVFLCTTQNFQFWGVTSNKIFYREEGQSKAIKKEK